MAEENQESSPETVVALMTKGEMDSQIDVAKRYPRSMEKFRKRATEMACMDDETAASCLYRRPVGKEGGRQVYAEGMSVRMAEIVGASYGNLRVYATLLSQTERQVVARGMAIDLEANFASSSEVVESTVDRNGKPFSERMSAVIAKAALAKARRDATFQVVPKALAKPVEQAVRKLLMGEAKSLDVRRGMVVAWINKLGIEVERVWKALGVAGPSEIGLDHIETLTGLRTAIKDGDTTIDEAFPAEALKMPKAIEEGKESNGPTTKSRYYGPVSGVVQHPEAKTDRTEKETGRTSKPKESPEDRQAEALKFIADSTDEEWQAKSKTWIEEAVKGQSKDATMAICRAYNGRNDAIKAAEGAPEV